MTTETEKQITGLTFREARRITWQQIRTDLQKLGYFAPPVFLDRYMRYRLLVVLLNHLATVIDRHPFRVYQAALCRAERTRSGRPYTPYKQAKATENGLVNLEKERDGIQLLCPYCFKDIMKAGGQTQEEVLRRIPGALPTEAPTIE